jgi:cytochrome c oxidase assembly factor CtaG
MPVAWPLAGLAITALLYAGGRRPSSAARSDACFYAGLGVVVLAIVGPVDDYADNLFWAHMSQHVLLTMVAPPLLLLGRPWPRAVRPLPLPARRSLARALHACRPVASPLAAFALFNVVLLTWHVPKLYDATLRNAWVHELEHLMFFITGLVFWTHLVPTSRRPRLSDVQRIAYGVGAIVVGWALAVTLGLASHPLYAHYAALGHRPGGISALADQQLAAGIMWVPASVPLTVAVFAAAYRLVEPTAARLRPRET